MTYRIKTVDGREYTTEIDVPLEGLTRWVEATDEASNKVMVQTSCIVAFYYTEPTKTRRKKMETKEESE